MKIEALEVSSHIANANGKLVCCGIFNNSLNFLSPSHQLITLHRESKGLSPMGWVLADTDFDQVACYVQLNSSVVANAGELMVSPELKLVGQHYIDLSAPRANMAGLQKLENLLPTLPDDIYTGLYGALNDYQLIAEHSEVQEMAHLFSEWLKGESIDWQHHLGRGPGLTPSSDDMLTGLLFSAYVLAREKVQSLTPFFEGTSDLSLLTTSVSQNYLNYAAQGIFSSYLVKLAQQMACGEDVSPVVFELLAVGHHSGADTLLGIELGYQAIKQCGYF